MLWHGEEKGIARNKVLLRGRGALCSSRAEVTRLVATLTGAHQLSCPHRTRLHSGRFPASLGRGPLLFRSDELPLARGAPRGGRRTLWDLPGRGGTAAAGSGGVAGELTLLRRLRFPSTTLSKLLSAASVRGVTASYGPRPFCSRSLFPCSKDRMTAIRVYHFLWPSFPRL